MTKEFLLHKDKKENETPPHIQAHLSLPYTNTNASQSQKSLHFADPPYIVNKFLIYLYLEK
jgi:hypothetical protein